ncbi:hypothetical protein OIU77_014651 [Salix suchowensis]|uniref:Uncharacterized protein n=1 Tax=Salix suchowensis TaxID=1278906 RepID=A0ABQ8ZYV9_9ROSI|nr:hypothetical protein OIU77_014651 [Salix suchowensis]
MHMSRWLYPTFQTVAVSQSMLSCWYIYFDAEAIVAAADCSSGETCAALIHRKQMAPSRLEAWARLFVTKYLGSHISTDRLILEEEGGETLTFEGTSKKYNLEAVLKVHNPQFYWKVITRAGIGLADAYIDGDFSFADKDQGLLDLFLVLNANRVASKSISKVNKKRYVLCMTSGLE